MAMTLHSSLATIPAGSGALQFRFAQKMEYAGVALSPLRGMDSKTMMAKILDEGKEFCGDHPRSDDIALMITRTG